MSNSCCALSIPTGIECSPLSSFAYLKTLPVQFLKIDGVFVKDIPENPLDLAMVHAINEVGQLFGFVNGASMHHFSRLESEPSRRGAVPASLGHRS
ncbi:MAG: EAL domain-containing protein [Gammaproteobacteria bacterium]|nr:EAL domain-containing protein [Gammaproteobacteria bacterium]